MRVCQDTAMARITSCLPVNLINIVPYHLNDDKGQLAVYRPVNARQQSLAQLETTKEA